jgi:hypothetical protein
LYDRKLRVQVWYPPPPEALEAGLHLDEYPRYADSVWDQRRINNVNQHFITAFLGIHLKDIESYTRINKNLGWQLLLYFPPGSPRRTSFL